MEKKEYIERWASHSKLFALEGIFNSYRNFKDKIVGCENEHIICYAKKGDLRVFYDKNEIDESEIIGHRFLKSKKRVINYVKRSEKAREKYLKVCSLIFTTNFKELSNRKIASVFRKLFDSYAEAMAYYRMSAEEFYLLSEEELKNYLRTCVDNVEQVYQTLTSCELNRHLASFKEKEDWFSLLMTSRKRNHQQLLVMLRKHASKYGFFGAGGGNPFGWDYNFFVKKYRTDFKKLTLTSLKKALQKIRKLDEEIIREKKEIIEQNEISQKVVNLTSNISLMTYQRMAMREDITKGAYLSRPIFTYIYSLIEKSLGRKIKFDILRQLSFEEMYGFLNSSKKINHETLRRRHELSVYALDKAKVNLITGQPAKKIVKKWKLAKRQTGKLKQTIIGNSVYSNGIIYGRAIVISNAKHSLHQQKLVEIMKRGEILITGMTRPNIILACEKAVAIVTDEGGITSHAAIISRELKKPCVVGTREATRTIKTGDCVRVDSDKGEVSLISEKIYKEMSEN